MPRKYNKSERAAIIDHLEWCIESYAKRLADYEAIPKANRPAFVQGNIDYWKNVIAGYRWALNMVHSFGVGSDRARENADIDSIETFE